MVSKMQCKTDEKAMKRVWYSRTPHTSPDTERERNTYNQGGLLLNEGLLSSNAHSISIMFCPSGTTAENLCPDSFTTYGPLISSSDSTCNRQPGDTCFIDCTSLDRRTVYCNADYTWDNPDPCAGKWFIHLSRLPVYGASTFIQSSQLCKRACVSFISLLYSGSWEKWYYFAEIKCVWKRQLCLIINVDNSKNTE